jgi:hypothetical protein
LEGDCYEYKTSYPTRDKEILTFILQRRIVNPKPKRPVFLAIRSHYDFSIMDDELDFSLNVGKPTPSLLGGLFFYKNVALFLDPRGSDGKYPDFFFPIENDLMIHLRNDFSERLSVPLPGLNEPILDPILAPVSDIFHD